MLQKLRRVETVNQVLANARIELAALINVPPSTEFRVVPPSSDKLSLPKWAIKIEQMERMAFENNPDIREKLYLSRISVNDAKKSLIAFLPGLELKGGRNYNSNSFMDSNRWFEWSSTLSLKVLKLLSLPDQLKYNQANKKLSDAQRIALRMAVLAQVHVADLNYASAVKQYTRANELYNIDERLTQQISKRQESDIQSMLERISQETSAIESVMRRYQTYSEVVAAVGRLHSTLGMSILKAGINSNKLEDLARYLGGALEARMSGISIETELKLSKKKAMVAAQKTKLKLAKIKAKATKQQSINAQRRNVSFTQEKSENIADDNLFLYPDTSRLFGNVDVPEVKEVTGYIKNLDGFFVLRGLKSGLDVVNQNILSGLNKANTGIAPTINKFSNAVVSQFQNKEKDLP